MSDDIKERLLKWYNLTGIEAVARIEALEAALASSQKFVREGCDIANDLRSQLARTQAQLAMRNSDLDECEAQLAGAREALEKAEYASRKDSLTESERLSCVHTVVCAAISKLALKAAPAK